MQYFLDLLVVGVALGSVYGLIAIGYTMVYGIIGQINICHGDIFMIGAFNSLIALLLIGLMGVTWVPLALVMTIIVVTITASAYGVMVERVAYRPLRGQSRLAPLISAIGMSIFLENVVQLTQGAKNKPIGPVIDGSVVLLHWDGVQLSVTYMQGIIVLATLALMTGLTLLIERTPLGRAQRACEQDMMMASLVGIDTNRTISITFMIGAALAAFAGLMVLLYYGVIDFYMGFLVGIKAFSAAVLGGVGSLPGAMLGGILIGIIEVFWSGYLSVEYKDFAAFAILVLVLIVRPTGLLGRPEVEKV